MSGVQLKIGSRSGKFRTHRPIARLLVRNLDFPVVDLIDDVVRVLAVDGASYGLSGAEDLLDGALELPGHGARSHDAGDFDDCVHGQVTVVLHIFDFLAVARWLLELLDDQGSGRWNHVDLGLSVLDGEFAGDFEALPVLSGLGNVFTDLLGRQTQRSDLGSQSRGRSNFPTNASQIDDFDFSRVELRRHDLRWFEDRGTLKIRKNWKFE